MKPRLDLRGTELETISIFGYSPEFNESIVNLIKRILEGEFGSVMNERNDPDLSNIQAIYGDHHGYFWIAVEDHTVIGTIALLNLGNHRSCLRRMYVAPEYRGSGVATHLLNYLN